MDEQNLITIEHNGEELVAEVLFTHEDMDTHKTYVVFQFMDSEEISAAVYVETSETEGYFEDIETEEEWDMLDDLLEEYFLLDEEA
ncbi:MAG: DUF1292 domain-containing protein [Acholeplasmataceae bacterium]